MGKNKTNTGEVVSTILRNVNSSVFDYEVRMGMYNKELYTKKANDSFTIETLLKVLAFCGYKLMVIDSDNPQKKLEIKFVDDRYKQEIARVGRKEFTNKMVSDLAKKYIQEDAYTIEEIKAMDKTKLALLLTDVRISNKTKELVKIAISSEEQK